MDDRQPTTLIELQEKLAEIFWFVKGQAQLARGNLSAEPESLTGDLDETERGVHKRIMELGQRLIGMYFEGIP